MPDSDAVLVPLYHVYIGVMAVVALMHAAAVGAGTERRTLHACFSAMAIVAVGFYYFLIAAVSSSNAVDAYRSYQFMRLAADIFVLLYPIFIALFLDMRSALLWVICGVWLILLSLFSLAGLSTDPSTDLSLVHLHMPWGEDISWLRGRNPALLVIHGVGMSMVAAVSFFLMARAQLLRLPNRNGLMTLCTAAFAIAICWDALMELEWVRGIYLAEHVVMGIFVVMSLELLAEFSRGVRANKRLRRLSTEMALTEQRERQNLAHLLHDGPLQHLALVGLHTDAVDAHCIRQQVQSAVQGIRSIVCRLNPPLLEQQGLISTLSWLAEETRKSSDVRCSVSCDFEGPRLTGDAQIIVFQCVQELVRNAVKHAACNQIDIICEDTGGLSFTVKDDGRGFDPRIALSPTYEGAHYGLFSIKQRLLPFGGRLWIDSSDRGTSATISLLKGDSV